MSKYTTEVRYICENYSGLEESKGYSNIAEIIANSREAIFDFPYPIFDEAYRPVLETKILRHFYTREICCETVGLWKHFLNMRMNEIMPYYNKLYESELIEFNPMYDVDLTTDHNKKLDGTRTENGSFEESGEVNRNREVGDNTTRTENGTSTVADNEKNDHWDLYQDTPQGGLTGVRQEDYLTNVRHITDDKTGSTATTTTNTTENNNRSLNEEENTESEKNGSNKKNGTIKDIEDYLQHIKGKTGGVSYSKMLDEFRATFLNIDVEIINKLNDLFFNLW